LAAKANAFLSGRSYVTPVDVREMAMDVLRHRVVVTYEAEAEERTSESIVAEILQSIDMP
jgi:MoxR-like ATPase